MSTDIQTSSADAKTDDPYRIGWRDIYEELPNGERVFRHQRLAL